jgi:hypothetical protein
MSYDSNHSFQYNIIIITIETPRPVQKEHTKAALESIYIYIYIITIKSFFLNQHDLFVSYYLYITHDMFIFRGTMYEMR